LHLNRKNTGTKGTRAKQLVKQLITRVAKVETKKKKKKKAQKGGFLTMPFMLAKVVKNLVKMKAQKKKQKGSGANTRQRQHRSDRSPNLPPTGVVNTIPPTTSKDLKPNQVRWRQ